LGVSYIHQPTGEIIMAQVRKDIEIYGNKPTEITYEFRDGRVLVHAWGIYPSHSVLAGQDVKQYVDSFDTVDQALSLYPEAEGSHPVLQPQNTFNHLSSAGEL